MTVPRSSALAVALILISASAFQTPPPFRHRTRSSSPSALSAIKVPGKGYDPKWKKKLTIAEQAELDGLAIKPQDVGLKGTVTVVFQQGNVTKTTLANPGQPIRDVASNAGQFVRYGCGKGECGTCEALCGGKWIRPCIATIPSDSETGTELLITVKEVKSKAKSSGKFYSARSFVMGFYNNLLGMVGFVQDRKLAKRNWEERQEYESNLAALIAAKKNTKERRERIERLRREKYGGDLAP
eukprot:CAMPEP_0183298878 /NCGR_PEP_ID=MMETSP0160_2-20130417/5764_1 /TAXON_ID=2839 ORGANISM="Odontella Sinensis, Strain Grunow 1884" /NCGR_SAMPLE_ID=MMETSP0160_2 /ASSEMBLY_ACC=CAM_ASM_000250 /LENGTH=240 /DNA_ID=CAMNT_0025460999 /DNA_START=135 /DNA_END=857 /DNA_ORIENTATION=+